MKHSITKAKLAVAVAELYTARVARREARKARASALEHYGECTATLDRCYQVGGDQADWCLSCRAVQPHREAFNTASTRASVALNRVLRLGQRLEGGGR